MAGQPDVLSSPPSSPRRWLALAVGLAAVGVAVTVALVDGEGAGTDRAEQPAATSSVPTSGPTEQTSTTIDPADRVTGSLPAASGTPSGTSAIEVAQGVADSYCDQIGTWRITLDGDNGEYFRVLVLMRPNGPAYRTVALRFELTWDTDHYNWAGSRSALESCP